MDEGVDSGPILKQVPFPIPPGIHRPELEAQLAQLGADLLSEALIPYLEGSLMPKDQSKIGISKTRRLTKDDGKIDWTESAVSIARKIQAYDPWPGTWTTWNGVVVKILLGDAVELTHTSPPGTAMSSEAYPLAVACGSGALRIDRIQLSGRKALGPSEFLLGQRGIIGAVLGS
jgi:methionyl-tRNA formyltransferase